MDIATLRSQLASGVVTVTFEKLNGEFRVMECTTNPGVTGIPPELGDQGHQVRVFDISSSGWRSFLFHRMISAIEKD